jgi:hypothetical protein
LFLTLFLSAAGCGVSIEGSIDLGGRPQDDLGGGADRAPCVDVDNDGYGENCPAGADCNDSDENVHPGVKELCDDGKDNDCNGATDEAGCLCILGLVRECYSGASGTSGVGICRVGLQACGTDGKWGPCGGEVVPGAESCNGTDDNCDGSTDEGLKNACGACGALPAEVCNNGLDDNCNGTVDENCGTCDPGCQ